MGIKSSQTSKAVSCSAKKGEEDALKMLDWMAKSGRDEIEQIASEIRAGMRLHRKMLNERGVNLDV